MYTLTVSKYGRMDVMQSPSYVAIRTLLNMIVCDQGFDGIWTLTYTREA